MTIHIEALTFDTIIGMLDFEREHTQPVVVECRIDYNYSPDTFIDYAEVVQTIELHMKQKRFALIEEALNALESLLSSCYPQMQHLYLKITKPQILPHAKVGLSAAWDY